ncbi:MAG: glycogen debranching enzyme N-terminal domain-containing protein, partial [Chitinophagaceae bacterium]
MTFLDSELDKLDTTGSIHIPPGKIWKAPSEWIETNGLGGWASSSVYGCNTRRYHGLLIAAIKPPVERMALVSKLEEEIIIGDKRFELGTNDYGDVIHPKGFQYIKSFSKDLFPEWTYKIGEVILKKTITMVQQENTTLVLYEVESAPHSFILELMPLISARDY